MGPMLSDNWPLLSKLGSGYFLDSIEIWVSPIEDKSMPNKPIYNVKDGPWPQQFNKDVEISKVHEYNNSIGGTISKDTGITLNQGKRNGQEIKLNFAPGKHSCHWETLEAMSGFHIIIKQVICCKIADDWWRKLKPNLKDFNENFESLMKSKASHGDLINVILEKKAPRIDEPKNSNVGNIDLEFKVMTQK
ncbi:543_t:CDS:2 [Diversispora eburnea]|uniref:543_t:CDS:1 n=1 Tax=Diversispora eburnea TaxID=1213867 RepID=A0A9N9CER8_9GLOM|nr:543_t:CDS:2 [Diversispora eburnea]